MRRSTGLAASRAKLHRIPGRSGPRRARLATARSSPPRLLAEGADRSGTRSPASASTARAVWLLARERAMSPSSTAQARQPSHQRRPGKSMMRSQRHAPGSRCQRTSHPNAGVVRSTSQRTVSRISTSSASSSKSEPGSCICCSLTTQRGSRRAPPLGSRRWKKRNESLGSSLAATTTRTSTYPDLREHRSCRRASELLHPRLASRPPKLQRQTDAVSFCGTEFGTG